ncbi:biosynthetic-type acetolactate synthase large subunit [Parasaccharibacter sp. TMW2.1890]|uniref:biosynthetic-type acetolactate synthase large subunit n=1 Tax=Parasaccharibacter sp. TMW2.1890 TaxID=2039289 RepID=UPI002010F799|nr:biosynthetic-type acetolactate synthase large subunit [Parasaccharibacter sp. TMW2.1890]MCL1515669.1 acetolactate synthase, large subunit, biosynthetic type [Parasaccharibacter sp. TMW2.1890]
MPASETAPMMATGAEVILRVLEEEGVDVIFGYPGGAVLPIYDALFKQKKIRHILVRHEQAATHAAEAYARSTGKVGVVLVTSGPGATNAVTGLMDAKMDSIPLVCLAGQVPVPLIGKDAFQEADMVGITRPATKKSVQVREAEALAPTIREAFALARSGRPGPVLVDLPKNITVSEAPLPPRPAEVVEEKAAPALDAQAVSQAVEAMKKARKPLLYVGGGVINAGPEAAKLLRQLAEKTGFPVTSTLMGLGAYPSSSDHFLGMLGMHGAVEANMAAHDCDVLVALGARFDDRVTGRVDGFSPHSFKIQADIDPREFGKIIKVDVALKGDLKATLHALLEGWGDSAAPDLSGWWQEIDQWRAVDGFGFEQDRAATATIKPQYAISRLYEQVKASGRDCFVSTEVGQHQMWAAQHFGFDEPNHWLTSGGLGTMGYGLPAAVGAQIAHPDGLVIDIAGEASTLMNIQELGTIAQYRLPVKIFILNNQYMGMVRQWQELVHDSRYSQSYSAALPDFVKLAESFGICGLRVETLGGLDEAIETMLTHEGPVLVDVHVEQEECCFPMIPSGASHDQMLLGPGRVFGGAELTEEGKRLV